MTGRQILDAMNVLKASRSVLAKHIGLRRRQLDVYSKTSTLAKAIQTQTSRFPFIARTVSNLADQDNNPQSSGLSSRTGPQFSSKHDPQTPKSEAVGGKDTILGRGTAHFGIKSGANPTTDHVTGEELGMGSENESASPAKDEKPSPSRGRDTFSDRSTAESQHDSLADTDGKSGKSLQPDSTNRTSIPTPSKYESFMEPDRARKLQRLAERQVPSVSAEAHPPSETQVPSSNHTQGKLDTTKQQDVFYTRPVHVSPVLSSLPRVKLPTNTTSTQDGIENLSNTNINQDVFYSAKHAGSSASDAQALPEEGQSSDAMYSEIFHSPRVARLLKRQGKEGGAQDPHTKKDHLPHEATEESAPNMPPTGSETADSIEKKEAESTRLLSEDIVEESTSSTSRGSEYTSEPQIRAAGASHKMLESRVPSSRLGRLWQYGGLATSMAFGAVGESIRRATGSGDVTSGSLMLSAGNMERLVAKLSKMRGAALKLGQMMSFQDSKMLPPAINEVLQRVQDRADFMPASQRNQVLSSDLGSNWRDLFSTFDEVPMAAASIGQVHGAVLKSSQQRVAVKVQYPGVADSIDSDLSNLAVLLTASKLLPKGLYLEKTIANARVELAWECDYVREANCGKRFQTLLHDEQDVFSVPSIIDEASGPKVLTMERMDGLGVTKAQNLRQDQKDWIGTQILRLCLREITEFKFMQTDPNWTNFLFNAATHKLELLDFGASRDFPDKFIKPYIDILVAAARSDRTACRDLSIKLGYLTGYESRAMLDAHVASVMTLAEPFCDTSPELYDFSDQTITQRVRNLIPVMMRERLAPPPEETYSLHRKLSGAFLLCARLGSRVRCRELFARAMMRGSVDGWMDMKA